MDACVTLVVVPRERFSGALASLDSIYEHTDTPFHLVYVDGGSPKPVRLALEARAARHGFQLLRRDRYLAPNQARNIGMAAAVRTPYVLFIDNDVIVGPGWLQPLIDCLEQTRAWAVGPITCIGRPEDEIVHLTRGQLHLEAGPQGRRVREEMEHRDLPLREVRHELIREPCGMLEFHCLLVRREALDRVGPFDEAIINTKDHIDFCLAVQQAGGELYFEPRSCITHVPPWVEFAASDLPYYLLRWSDRWALATLRHFNRKWGLAGGDEERMARWIRPHRRIVFAGIEQRFRSPRARRWIGRPLARVTARATEILLTPLARLRAAL